MMPSNAVAALPLLLLLSLLTRATGSASGPFRIDVVDLETGRGVPLVHLETSGYVSYYTDSAGVVAFDEPGLLGRHVFFRVTSDGYINSFNLPGSPDTGVLLATRAGVMVPLAAGGQIDVP